RADASSAVVLHDDVGALHIELESIDSQVAPAALDTGERRLAFDEDADAGSRDVRDRDVGCRELVAPDAGPDDVQVLEHDISLPTDAGTASRGSDDPSAADAAGGGPASLVAVTHGGAAFGWQISPPKKHRMAPPTDELAIECPFMSRVDFKPSVTLLAANEEQSRSAWSTPVSPCG